MIVRDGENGYILFKQYDHSLMSAVFISHWKERPAFYRSLHFAIEQHDVGWEPLDRTIKWNEQTNRPYSFIDYPLTEKLTAYRDGISRVEKRDPYAGYLCSLHLSSFFRDAKDKQAIEFRDNEIERQRHLERTFTKRQRDLIEVNYNLLKLCDNLSLFICLNRPGENTHPWYKDGIEWNGEKVTPEWKTPSSLTFSPNPFTHSFKVAIPYQVVSLERQILHRDILTIHIE